MTIQIILALFFAVPLYLFLLFAYRSPKELLTIGKSPESEYDIPPNRVRYIQRTAVFSMFAGPFIIIAAVFKPAYFVPVLLAYIIGIIAVAARVFLAGGK